MMIYLMAVPCSGKTHFASAHPTYRGVRIVDFSPINKRAGKDPDYGARVAPGDSYDERILAYLHAQPGPVCVLGRCGPDDPAAFAGITLAAVLPTLKQHRRFSDLRRQAHAESKWADFAEVEAIRARMQAYVARHHVPLYETFEQALDDLAGAVS